MENKNTIELNVVRLDGGLSNKKIASNNNAEEVDYLYLPDIGINLTLKEAISAGTISFTKEQSDAIKQRGRFKFADSLSYEWFGNTAQQVLKEFNPIFTLSFISDNVVAYRVNYYCAFALNQELSLGIADGAQGQYITQKCYYLQGNEEIVSDSSSDIDISAFTIRERTINQIQLPTQSSGLRLADSMMMDMERYDKMIAEESENGCVSFMSGSFRDRYGNSHNVVRGRVVGLGTAAYKSVEEIVELVKQSLNS